MQPNAKTYTLNVQGRLHEIKEPLLMGILNITPDSFSDGGNYFSMEKAIGHARKLIEEGAGIIDIGPQSTRPGAEKLTAKEEIARLGTLIRDLKKEFPSVLLSLDSFWSETVRFAYDQGLDIANDISAGGYDPKMFSTVAELGLPYILMHVNPTYETMHLKENFKDITLEVNRFLLAKARELEGLGVKDIILDPGFGFGKKVKDQEKLLSEVGLLGYAKYPLLIGISRKSFIYKPLGKSPLEIDKETQERHLNVLRQGAKILRVHDVGSTKKTLDLFLKEQKEITKV